MQIHHDIDKTQVDRIRHSTIQLLEDKANLTPIKIARKFQMDRAVVYRSLDGQGSQRVRVYIALMLDRPPSSIWTFTPKYQQVLDDYFFNHPDDLRKSIPFLTFHSAKLN